jgi:membrane-associated protease RseP (regulator of RpoE activity)
MSTDIPSRRALFDIAAAGPIAGLVVALPLTVIGLLMSDVRSLESLGAGHLTLGEPLLFQGLSWLLFQQSPENYDLVLHDVAFAGWVGMFVTALNLLPVGQLDGGHILYSVFGRRSRYVAMAAFAVLALVTFISGYSYIVFLVLLWFMGVGHPPTLNDGVELGPVRRKLAVALLIVFIVCFTPSPLQMAGS